MRYKIDETSNTSAYMQLYTMIKEDITGGIYEYGAKLPSKRLLAEETGVSVITTEHAYSILCDEGYIEAKEKKGYFVIYRNDDFISSPQIKNEHVNAQLAVSNKYKGSFPYSVLTKTMRKVMLDYYDSILVKSPNHGCPELRSAVSEYLGRSCGISASPEQIIIGSGAEYLYSLIVQLLGNDRIFALEDPSYEKIRRVYNANGVKTELLKLGNNGILNSELEGSNATVLHITPFNSYPSGISADASKRREYISWASKRNGYIIEDNYDSELTVSTKNDDTVFSMSESSNVIYLNTFSHTIAPSFRVGYMVLPNALLDEFEEKLGFYSCTVPVFEQYVISELISSGDFERHINRVRRAKRKKP